MEALEVDGKDFLVVLDDHAELLLVHLLLVFIVDDIAVTLCLFLVGAGAGNCKSRECSI